jgi:hypothetical protein
VSPAEILTAKLRELLVAQGNGPTDHLRIMFNLAVFLGEHGQSWPTETCEQSLDVAIKHLAAARRYAKNLGVASSVLAALDRRLAREAKKRAA